MELINAEYEKLLYIKYSKPYVYNLSSKNKRLYYFGVDHANNPNDILFYYLDKSFELFQPQLVLVEGLPQINLNEDNDFWNIIKSANSSNLISKYGENLYAAQLAKKNGSNVFSPEPKLYDEALFIFQNNLSKEYIFLYYMCRFIFQWYRVKEGYDFLEYMNQGITYLEKELRWNDFDFSFKNLNSIHKNIFKTNIITNECSFYKNIVDPVFRKKNNKYFNLKIFNVSRLSSIYRDKRMLEQIEIFIRLFDKIFIVYGSSHAYVQKRFLIDLFSSLDI